MLCAYFGCLVRFGSLTRLYRAPANATVLVRYFNAQGNRTVEACLDGFLAPESLQGDNQVKT